MVTVETTAGDSFIYAATEYMARLACKFSSHADKIGRMLAKSYIPIRLRDCSEAGGIGNERCELFPDVIRNNNCDSNSSKR